MNEETPLTQDLRRLKARQSELKAIQSILLSPEGQIFCNYLIRTFCMTTTLDANPQLTAFKEGQRALAMQIIGTAHKIDRFAPQINEMLRQIEQEQQE
jgi:hypothetical protein